jgi:hypothetical protein
VGNLKRCICNIVLSLISELLVSCVTSQQTAVADQIKICNFILRSTKSIMVSALSSYLFCIRPSDRVYIAGVGRSPPQGSEGCATCTTCATQVSSRLGSHTRPSGRQLCSTCTDLSRCALQHQSDGSSQRVPFLSTDFSIIHAWLELPESNAFEVPVAWLG